MNNFETLDNNNTTKTVESHEIANLDEYDYLMLLMESRIIQAS